MKKALSATAIVILSSSLQAQVISNGTSIGTNVGPFVLSPVSGTGSLLVNSGSKVGNGASNNTQSITVSSAGTYYITNNGVITNSGTLSSSQPIDIFSGTWTIVNGTNGVIARSDQTIYALIRSAQTTSQRVGAITNYGLLDAPNTNTVGVAFNYGQYTVHNEGTINARINHYGGGVSSLTINQVAGEITANVTNSIASFAAVNTVNVSGGKISKTLDLSGATSNSVNLSGGEINGNVVFTKGTNSVLVTGGSLNGDVNFTSNSTDAVNFSRGDAYTYTNVISGNGRLTNSSGTTTLTRSNTYTGTTAVAGGGLIINGSIAGSAVTVKSGGFLGGSGTVGSLTVESGGTVAPGNSPGTLNINGDINWLGGGSYNWQIVAATGAAGTGWDLQVATGGLDLNALSASSKFNINLWSLMSTGPDVSGALNDFDANQTYTWTLVTASNGITGFAADKFNINAAAFNGTGGFANGLGGGTFSVAQSGNNLNLVFTAAGGAPVPEPGTWAAAALLAGGAAFVRWRKRAKVS